MDTYIFVGRIRKPWRQKINPIWWLGNDDEQQLPDWYQPQWFQLRRRFYWYYLRNPLQNLRAYLLGCQDKNYTAVGRSPVLAVQRNDLVPPQYGWQWCVLYGGDLWVPRGFVSYSGKHVVCYLGWQASGFFGMKFNLHGG